MTVKGWPALTDWKTAGTGFRWDCGDEIGEGNAARVGRGEAASKLRIFTSPAKCEVTMAEPTGVPAPATPRRE